MYHNFAILSLWYLECLNTTNSLVRPMVRAYLERGHWAIWVARIAKLHRKVSKIEACPPPPLQVGHQALGSKSPDFGRKWDEIWVKTFFFLLFTWFRAKNGTKFECDNFKFWSMFLSNFLKFLPPPPPPPPPLFKILRTLLPMVSNYDTKLITVVRITFSLINTPACIVSV